MPRLLLAALALLLAVPPAALAQSLAAQPDAQPALDYLARNWNRHGLTQADVSSLVVSDIVPGRRGMRYVYVHQAIDGVPVVSGQMTVSLTRDGRVIHAAGQLEPGLLLRAVRAGVGVAPEQAVAALAREAGLRPTGLAVTTAPSLTGGTAVLTDGGIARLPIQARLVYADDRTGAIRLAWETTLFLRTGDHDWYGLVDAATGRVLVREDRLVHDTFGDAHAPVAPSLAPLAETATERAVAGLLPAPGASFGAPAYRVYPYPFESPQHLPTPPPTDARTLVSGMEHPVASPFGWHDTDGVAGAEFTTTRGNNTHAYLDRDDNEAPDAGGEPDGGASLLFDFPIDFAQQPNQYVGASVTNLFYWSNLIHDVLYQYGFDSASGNFQTNTYGLGGVGNDAVDSESQSGADICNEVNPCVNNANFSTPSDGQRPRMQMYVGNNVAPLRDGAFDAAVVAHEYVHGLSIRLTGGPTNVGCLSTGTYPEQAGEGWSDWYALMMTMQPTDTRSTTRGMATYLFGQPVTGPGIRPAPYNTDFAVNNFTYQRTRSGVSVPHGVGFVWATILWEVTWDLIDAHGFDPDIHNADGTAGNQIAMALVTEALKMQPCGPGFVDARNAVLAADQALYDGAHTELLWAAFARRGLGLGADQGSSTSNSDNTESFIEPEEIAPDPVTDLAAVPNGDYVTLTFTATGDDGDVGTATTYAVRYASAPILTDEDFTAATPATVTATPQVAGTAESLVVEGLTFGTPYHFALKVSDESFNTSTLSNSVATTTLTAPTASIPTTPIAVTTESTETATLTIGNAGPSDLRFSLGLSETTTRRAAAPAADAPEAPGVKGDDGPTGAAQRLDGGGPDAFGYRWADSNEPGGPAYNWIDISTTGTAVTLGDDASATVPLPFAFPYYGVDQNSVRIVSNGFLAFGGTSNAFTNAAIPTADAPNAILAAYWDDLNPSAGGSIRYQDMGDGRFVVSWIGVPHYVASGGRGSFTFQVILSSSGAVVYQYQNMAPDALDATSATIGIEDAAGADGLQVVHNAAYIENNLAIRFSALWVETDLAGALVPAGSTQDVVLTFDASGLTPGVYSADLTVVTNDPSQAAVVIPVTLTVGVVSNEDGGALDFAGTHRLGEAYPNPAASSARVDLAVAEAQTVRVDLYDTLGRRVGTLHDGPVAARVVLPVALDTGALATGTYVLRVTGETFADTRRVTVSR